MIKEYDRVVIKSTGLVGDVVDIAEVNGETICTVESAERIQYNPKISDRYEDRDELLEWPVFSHKSGRPCPHQSEALLPQEVQSSHYLPNPETDRP